MIGPDAVRELLQKQPFVPLLFRTKAGVEYTVWHADRVWVGNRSILVSIPKAASLDESTTESWVELAFGQIDRIEPIASK